MAKSTLKQMAWLEMRFGSFWRQSSAITTNQQESSMANTADFDELAGRINGMGQALLRLTAELEMQGVIAGPRVSAAWRRAAEPFGGKRPAHRATHKVLLQLSQLLDEARQSRMDHGQSQVHPPQAARAVEPEPC